MGRIVRTGRRTHLSVCDICMLIATCCTGRGLPRRKRMRLCRPWIRICPRPAPNSQPADI
ncbi:protein GbcA [Pseudomonas leptonychotis]|uniref:Protein GbcA n=1 Tax=Pseudomonas leptonychotis TaxID=2448482 RepID=A0A4T2A2D5_9PSED|nr:protein GbcA [Pseudomonas leptonychotis]